MDSDVVIPSADCSPYQFGASLAASEDRLLVGSPYRYYGARQDEGIPPPVACLFTRGDGGWTCSARLEASDPGAAEGFGRTVALSANAAIVGAPGDEGEDGPVHELRRSGDGPFRVAAMWDSPDRPRPFGDLLSQYGAAIACDDHTLAVGAHLESAASDADAACEAGGAVYLFDRQSASPGPFATLRGRTPREGFGTAVALNGDLLVVGAAGPYSKEQLSGAAYVYRRQSSGEWRALCRVEGRDPGEEFGAAVALSQNRFAVAAPGRPGRAGGRVDLFEVGDDGCSRLATVAEDPGFGKAVALCEDRLAIGQPLFPKTGRPARTGRVGLYRVGPAGEVRHERWLVAADAPPQARLGTAVTLGPDYVAAGAPGLGEDDAGVGFVLVSRFSPEPIASP